MKIILDTNFLLIPGQFKVDIFREIEKVCPFKCEFVIIDKTIDELEKIFKVQHGKHRNSAKLALAIIKQKNISFIKGKENRTVDDIILELARRHGYVVATQDRMLKARLKKLGVRFLTLRQKKYVILEE